MRRGADFRGTEALRRLLGGVESTVPPRALILFFAAFGLLARLIWLSDMEYKGDERLSFQFVRSILDGPITLLAPVSGNAGIAHSSGFFYWVALLSGGSADPLVQVRAIASFNAAAILFSLWLVRKSWVGVLTVGMAAVSWPLVIHSRKLWSPDLMAPWSLLAVVFLMRAFEGGPSAWTRRYAWGASALCFVAAAHMYLPGGVVAAVATVAVAFVLWKKREFGSLRTWMLGCSLAWATFLPYFYRVSRGGPEVFGQNFGRHDWPHISGAFMGWVSAASPITFLLTYFFPGGPPGTVDPARTLVATPSVLLILATGLWMAGLWIAVDRTLAHRNQARQDPIVLSAVIVWAMTTALAYCLRIGNAPHYWLGALPVLFYWIAWSCELGPSLRLRKLLIASCFLSALAVSAFLLWVHRSGGLPGEYGTSYRLQTAPHP